MSALKGELTQNGTAVSPAAMPAAESADIMFTRFVDAIPKFNGTYRLPLAARSTDRPRSSSWQVGPDNQISPVRFCDAESVL